MSPEEKVGRSSYLSSELDGISTAHVSAVVLVEVLHLIVHVQRSVSIFVEGERQLRENNLAKPSEDHSLLKFTNQSLSYRADSILVLAGDGTIDCLVRSIIHDSLLENRVGRGHKRCSCGDESHTDSNEDRNHLKWGHDGLPSLQPLLSEVITGRSVGLHWLGHDVRIDFISGRNLEQAREIK